MGYRLKKNVEAFTVVDGPFEKKQYKPDVEYEEVPPHEKHKFEKVKKKPAKEDKPVKPVKEAEPVKVKGKSLPASRMAG